jgi:hypothetical protein
MSQIPRTYRVRPAAAAAACVVLLATACSGTTARQPAAAGTTRASSRPASAGSSAASPPARPVAATAPGSRAPSPASAPAPASPPPAEPQQCATSGLGGSIGQANGAAGSIYYPLVFTNTSGQACTMFGYPGVSFVTGISGRELGGAAVRNPTFAAQAVMLAPGAAAHASLQVAIAQIYPAATCKPVTAHWLRIYPPGQLSPLYVKFTAVTCTGTAGDGSTLGIYVVRPGPTGP